ncbi:hypothetical protein AB0K18_42750 [Nonomuraea sp. NPDC049421]|uniref:hypothetical protein n=1 Tax=Nonomuraea sp. NPDC049421 TaxID=3155275 RepID=UPI003425995B
MTEPLDYTCEPSSLPHHHPEYVPFGQRGTVQSIPYYAVNQAVPSNEFGTMVAVKLTVPADTMITSMGVASDLPAGGSAGGTWRAALYSADEDGLPLAVSGPWSAPSGVWWKATFYQPLPAADEARPVLAVIDLGAAAGMTFLVHEPYRPELVGARRECYKTADLSTLPVRFTTSQWTFEPRVPLVTLY